ncbi:MAG TPA: extracellular solute-binding protein [Acidobacteriaceae bacterium]|nr:extracellular solute-binding protein [Acidobacteriaceae bacterium]
MTPRQQLFRIAVRRYDAFEQAIRMQWQAFEEKANTGLTIDLVPLDLHPLQHALFTSNGMASGDWDVAFVATDWVSAMNDLGCALDLAPMLAEDPSPDWPHGWTASLLRLQAINYRILGVPYHDGPECLIYRRDLFEDPAHRERFRKQCQRELAPPATWQQFHELARFFHQPAQKLYGTAFAAYPDGHNSVYDLLLQLWTRGGGLFTVADKLNFLTPEAEAALTFYRDILTDREAIHPNCLTLDSVALGARFAAGELAMMVNWFGFATAAHSSPNSNVRGKVDIAKLPAEPPANSVSLNVYWILSIASGSPHQQAAWRFLRHTLTPAMDRLTTLCGAIGCRKSTWIDPQVNAQIPFYQHLDELHQVAREIPQRSDWPAIARTIDMLVTQTVTTSTPIRNLLEQAQRAHA